MWKSGRNINSRRAALAEGYMEDTRESRGRKFSGSTAMILGLFITLELMIGGCLGIVILCSFQLNRINDYESQIRKLKSQLAKEQKGENINK